MGLEICPKCSKALLKQEEKCPRRGHHMDYAQMPKGLEESTKMIRKGRAFRPVRACVLVIATGILIYGLCELWDPGRVGVETFVAMLAGFVMFYLGIGIKI